MERGISSSRILFIVPLPIIFRNGFQFGNSSGHNCSIFDTSDVYLAFYTRADRELISLRSLTFNVTLLSIGDGARPSPPPLIDGRARGGPPPIDADANRSSGRRPPTRPIDGRARGDARIAPPPLATQLRRN
jgi:hypothetical protein